MRNTDLILQYLCSDVGVVSYKFLDLCNFFLCHCLARTSRTRPVINLRFPVFELNNPTSNCTERFWLHRGHSSKKRKYSIAGSLDLFSVNCFSKVEKKSIS